MSNSRTFVKFIKKIKFYELLARYLLSNSWTFFFPNFVNFCQVHELLALNFSEIHDFVFKHCELFPNCTNFFQILWPFFKFMNVFRSLNFAIHKLYCKLVNFSQIIFLFLWTFSNLRPLIIFCGHFSNFTFIELLWIFKSQRSANLFFLWGGTRREAVVALLVRPSVRSNQSNIWWVGPRLVCPSIRSNRSNRPLSAGSLNWRWQCRLGALGRIYVSLIADRRLRRLWTRCREPMVDRQSRDVGCRADVPRIYFLFFLFFYFLY